MAAARCPTGPVPASTAARTPASGCAASTVATAAAAVVLQPLASSMTETRKSPKNCFRTAANTASARARSLPPTRIAVRRLCLGARV